MTSPPSPRVHSHKSYDRAECGESKEGLNLPSISSSTDTDKRSVLNIFRPGHLQADLDPKCAVGPLTGYCFINGYIDAITFSSVFVWCGFQTGNFAQLALAVARLIERDSNGKYDLRFHIADQQALVSLLAFLGGALFARIGTRIGTRSRIWLVLGTLIQTALTLAASICLWKSREASVANDRGDPSWTSVLSFVALGLLSASMGLQGVMCRRLDTSFSAGLVLTTAFCELMSDPKLFDVRSWVHTRDHKVITASMIFLGAFVGRALTETIGAPVSLGIAAGFRALLAVSWLFVPSPVT